MKYLTYISMLMLFISTGCNNKQKDYREDVEAELREEKEYLEWYEDENSLGSQIDSLGYYGVYENSHFPEGSTLKTTLVLYDNQRYKIESVDLGGGRETEEEHGTYMIFGDLLTLVSDDNGAERYYKTTEEELNEVDKDKNAVPVTHSTNFKIIRK